MRFIHSALSQRLPIRVVKFSFILLVRGGVPVPARPYTFANDQ
jgi:hypothetical protein